MSLSSKIFGQLPFGSEFPPGSRNVIENSIRHFSIGLQRFFKCSLKICNFNLCRKIFEHCHLVQNFPLVPEMLSKIQSDPSPLGYGVFFQLDLENMQFEFVAKYLNIAIWFRIYNRVIYNWALAANLCIIVQLGPGKFLIFVMFAFWCIGLRRLVLLCLTLESSWQKTISSLFCMKLLRYYPPSINAALGNTLCAQS